MAFHNIPPNGFPDIPDMEELEAVVKDVASVKTSVAGLTTDVSNLSDNKANQITIAPFFSAEASYEVGDLVYYNGLSYRCTNDHEGEWDADDFAATTVAGELATLKSGLMSRAAIVANGEISSNSSATAQLVSGHLYIVILGHPYSEGGIAIVSSYTSGSNKVTWIKSKTGVTITEDDNVVLTISADATVWFTVVDMGTAYT